MLTRPPPTAISLLRVSQMSQPRPPLHEQSETTFAPARFENIEGGDGVGSQLRVDARPLP